jgi:hypothetical protein
MYFSHLLSPPVQLHTLTTSSQHSLFILTSSHKGFACGLATIIATLASVPLFGFELKPSFFVGMVIVLGSSFLYGGTIKISKEVGKKERERERERERVDDEGTAPCVPSCIRSVVCAALYSTVYGCVAVWQDKAY